jgi:ribonuclease J
MEFLILNIDTTKNQLVIDPNVTTRGFVVVNDNQELLSNIQNKVRSIVNSEISKPNYSLTDLKNRVILDLNTYIIESTGRRPLIMPMIFEIK